MNFKVIHGDALAAMRDLDSASIDAIITDPPYFKVKDDAWDRAWETADHFMDWFGELADEWRRLLVPNGSLYVFASSRMAARVELCIGERFNVLNHIVWRKRAHAGRKNRTEDQRAFFPCSERIVFAEHRGSDNMARGLGTYHAKCEETRRFVFEPLRAYLVGEMERAGWTKGTVEKAWREMRGTKGGMAGHWFGVSQWELPTRANYEWLRSLFNGDHLRREYEDLRREYEDLRREYEDLRREYEDLRRPFSVSRDVQWEDVWDFESPQKYDGKHPCEKPIELMEHIVSASTRPGALVLDCFAGSGSTGAAALNLGRRFVGIESDAHWVEQANDRLSKIAPSRARIAAARPLDPTPDMFA